MKPQAMNIIKMISKPLNQRMPFQGVELTKFVQKLPFFRRFFPFQSQKFISLCLSSFLLEFNEGENLYGKENKPDLIYIIVQGLIQVKSKDNQIARQVKSFDLIGHVEVIFGLKERGQQVKALSNTYCMVIKSQNLKSVWEKQQQIQKAFHYLKSNRYFETLSEYDMKSLSLMMVKNSFRPGEVLINSGILNQKIIFIIYGETHVIKKLKVKNSEKQVVLESLQQMDSFGQYQSINRLLNQVSLRAASSGSFYTIMISQVSQIKHPFVKLAKQKGLPYPQKEQLQFRFQVQSLVQKHKNQVKRKLNLYK